MQINEDRVGMIRRIFLVLMLQHCLLVPAFASSFWDDSIPQSQRTGHCSSQSLIVPSQDSSSEEEDEEEEPDCE